MLEGVGEAPLSDLEPLAREAETDEHVRSLAHDAETEEHVRSHCYVTHGH